MSTTVQTGGANYAVPAQGDTGWAQGTGNLSAYLIALASTKLDTMGGAFTLTADANFGATFGIVSAYFKSVSLNIATAGALRLANTDLIEWRNGANSGNNTLGVSSGNVLQYNGVTVGSASAQAQSFTSQTSVTVTHNLGHYPLVQVLDGSGNVILPDSINHGSTNAFTVTFNPAASGTVLWVG